MSAISIQYNDGPYAAGDPFIVMLTASGDILIENELPPGASGQIPAPPPGPYQLGTVPGPGQYTLHILSQDDHYFAFLMFLPNDAGTLDLTHLEIAVQSPAPVAYSTDALSAFLAAVFEPGQPAPDRLDRAFSKAYADHAAEGAVALGSTVMICAVAGASGAVGLAVGKFCVGSAVGTALEFARFLTDALIDVVYSDSLLTADQQTFLKILVGSQGVLTSLAEAILAPSKVAAAVNLVEAMAGGTQMASSSNAINFGAATSSGFVKRLHVFYEIGDLPLP